MKIDLRLRLINPDIKVWRIFPGRGYSFRDAFRDQGVVFLDAPLLDVDSLRENATALAAVSLSSKARREIIENGASFEPKLRIEEFKDERPSQSKSLFISTLRGVLFDAKAGDIVVMPSTLRDRRIYAAEFLSDEITKGYYPKYGSNPIPARSVRWITAIQESQLSEGISNVIRIPNYFTVIERQFWVELISLCYSNFQFKDEISAMVYNESDYTDADSAFLSVLSRMASAIAQYDVEGDDSIFRSMLEMVIAPRPTEFGCSHETDIHSPGFNRYRGTSIAAVAMSALLAIFVYLKDVNSTEEYLTQVNALEVVNTAAVQDPSCPPRVSSATKRLLLTTNIDEVLRLCQTARDVERRARIRSGATAIPE